MKIRLYQVGFKMITRRQGGGDEGILNSMLKEPTTKPTKLAFEGDLVLSKSFGFTLVETMVALIILLLTMTGLIVMLTNSIKLDKIAKLRELATDVMTSDIEQIKMLGYTNINIAMLETTFGYAGWGSLTQGYQFSGINTTCPSPFNYCRYRGVERVITQSLVGGVERQSNQRYTLKLSVEENFLQNPVLRRLSLDIFWVQDSRLRSLNLIFMVERR